jgi:hypothetical protein
MYVGHRNSPKKYKETRIELAVLEISFGEVNPN